MRMLLIVGFCSAALGAAVMVPLAVWQSCPVLSPTVEKPALPAGPRLPTTGGERF
jgi:hypothetical protein